MEELRRMIYEEAEAGLAGSGKATRAANTTTGNSQRRTHSSPLDEGSFRGARQICPARLCRFRNEEQPARRRRLVPDLGVVIDGRWFYVFALDFTVLGGFRSPNSNALKNLQIMDGAMRDGVRHRSTIQAEKRASRKGVAASVVTPIFSCATRSPERSFPQRSARIMGP